MKKQNIKFVLGLLAFGILLACTQTPEQIAEKARNSTVRLDSYIYGKNLGRGSGFFVERDQIVTNIHVVAGADKVTARLVGKETEYTISGVVAFDAKNDLVILKTAEKSGKPLVLDDSNAIEPGTSIFAIGTPVGGEEGQITHGTFHSIRKSDEQLRLKTTFSLGNSGGPVLNWESTEVIGVVVASSGTFNISYAIPSNIIRELLKRRRPDGDVEPLHEWSNKKKNPAIFAYLYIRFASETSTDDAEKVKEAIGYLNKVNEDIVIEDNRHLAVGVYENKGRLLLRGLRDHKAAIENFLKLTELIPDYWIGYYHLGYAFLQSAMASSKDKISQYESAIDNFNKFIDLIEDNGLNPDAAAYLGRGLAKMELGQCKFTLGQSKDDQKEVQSLYEAAIRDLDEAIRDQGKAMELLQDSVNIDQRETFKKDYARTYHSRGYMKLMLADLYKSEGNTKKAQRLYEEAIKDLDEATRLGPSLKTSVQQMQKRAKEALEQLKK